MLYRYYIQDASVLEVAQYQPNTGIEIYEVIRVIEGVPLFLEDHLKRFYHSAWLLHLEIPIGGNRISDLLKGLMDANKVWEGNIRFSWCFRPTGRFHAYFIPHYYPDAAMVKEGVTCGICFAERQDPNAKVVQANLRETADRLIAGEGFYEVLLVSRDGKVTEGSRSNVFFIKEGNFFTAPAEEVLPGITRQKVLELLNAKGCPVTERSLKTEELSVIDAAFLTGTSPKVLPVRRIGDFIFSTEYPLVTGLISDYNNLIDNYIINNR